jgi:hypothetical protein
MICEAAIGRCWVFGPEVEMFLEPALTCGFVVGEWRRTSGF